jgi:Ca-activated chloride channel homolog
MRTRRAPVGQISNLPALWGGASALQPGFCPVLPAITLRMRRAVTVLAALSTLAFAQDPAPPVFRATVRLVRILATVKDQKGEPVGGLEKTSFEVRDNGVPQQIAVFERQTEQPLSIAILIDNSGSTASDLKYETDSVTRFVRAVMRSGNEHDAVALYSFNWQVVQQTAYTRDPALVDRRLHQLVGDAGTSMYDAILLAARDMQERPGRKVLVVVTDGGDTLSKTSFQRAAEAAQLADAVIFPVLVMPVTNNAGRNIGGENALITLAQRTGGQVFQPNLGAQMDHAFDGILLDLRTQYLVAFYPKDVPLTADRFHTLAVTAGTDPAWKVAARSGYYGEALSAPGSPQGNQSQSVDVTPSDETVRGKKPPPPKGAKAASGKQVGKGSQ